MPVAESVASEPAPVAPARLAGVPSHRGLPWLGAPWEMLSHPGAYLLDGYRRLGPVFQFRLFGFTMVALCGPEANRHLLVTAREQLSHGLGYAMVREVLGDGLLFQDGEIHRRNRTLMTPAFHAKGVAEYAGVMAERTREHVARWAATGNGPMYERLRHLTFDVMARLVLGLDADVALAELSAQNDALARGTSAFLRVGWRCTTYGRGLAARDALRAYLRGVIARRRDVPGSDALGLLMAARDDAGAALTDDELLEQAVILMFAGHETTTSMLASLLLALRDHPDWQARLVAEQDRVVGDGPLRPEHIGQLRDLDLVLKEVERRWPPISLCQRGVTTPLAYAGHTLPAGTLVVYSPWVTHHMPEVFRDPDRFDPERFAPPREEHRAVPYALVGFGGGPRLCIGQAFALLEMKIVASELLRRWRVTLAPGPTPVRWVPTLHPRNGLPGTVAPR